MALVSAYRNKHRNSYHVVSASKEDGVSATLMGGNIQTFTSVITDKTFADVETSPSKHADNLPLPIRISPSGGSQRIKIVIPVDQLLNPESLQVRIGWKLKKLSAAGVATDITNLDAIVPTGGVYSIRKVDVVINNKTQFGSSVNRDYGPERRRMEILRGIGATMDDLELTYNRYNRFHPNPQTMAENTSGKYQAYTEAGKEVFNNIELAREGILGATSLFPNVITEFDLVVHYKPILEMFAEEAHTANTDAISSSYLEITTVTVAKQCTVPSTDLWKALRDASTAGGGKGSLPSYPAKVVDVYNGPRTFPVTSTTLSVPVTGSEVPDDVFLCVREQSNIATTRGSTAYLSLPDVKCASMTVATQGRHAFQHTGESPFSDSTSGVTSRASLDAK